MSDQKSIPLNPTSVFPGHTIPVQWTQAAVRNNPFSISISKSGVILSQTGYSYVAPGVLRSNDMPAPPMANFGGGHDAIHRATPVRNPMPYVLLTPDPTTEKIKQLSSQLREKDEQILILTSSCASNQKQIEELQSMVAEKQEIIKTLNECISSYLPILSKHARPDGAWTLID